MSSVRLAAVAGAATLAAAASVHAAVPPAAPLEPVHIAAATDGRRAAQAAAARQGEAITVAMADTRVPARAAQPFKEQRKGASPLPAVPMPGALWLFGSALLAFLGISARRKF